MASSCAFCAIARGEAKASVVVRDAGAVAFLDARPVFSGHVLVIPERHVADLEALPAVELAPLFGLAQRLSRAVRDALGADGAFVAVNHRVSQSVPHLHVHVVPRRKGDGLRGFFWPRTAYASEAERDAVAARIAAALSPG